MNKLDARYNWLQALRSGEYEQGKGALKDGMGRYCCLGVACAANGLTFDGCVVKYDGYNYITILPDQLREVLGIQDQWALIIMNDSDKKSFNEIADYMVSVWRKEWLKALRDGGYGQAKWALRVKDVGHCCLGVACDVNGVALDIWAGETPDEKDSYSFSESSEFIPPKLATILGLSDEMIMKLVDMNDTNGMSFAEIADFLEGEWSV